jgi:UDP-N-acetylglucosamine:LPS N-acetylglucosamine transferase
MILDREINGQILAAKVRAFINDRARLERIAAAARALGRPGAAAKIVDECYAMVGLRAS